MNDKLVIGIFLEVIFATKPPGLGLTYTLLLRKQQPQKGNSQMTLQPAAFSSYPAPRNSKSTSQIQLKSTLVIHNLS